MSNLNTFTDLNKRFKIIQSSTSAEIRKLFNSENEEDRKKARQIGLEIEKLMVELQAFIKVDFGKDSEYMSQFLKINFLATEREKAENLHKVDALNDYKWENALNRLRTLFMQIEAEIKIKNNNRNSSTGLIKMTEGWKIFWAGTAVALYFTLFPLVCQYGKDQSQKEWSKEKKELNNRIDSLRNILRPTFNIVTDSIPKPKKEQ